jgi:predicted NBD/HSP70 family sugar kinase/transposase
MTLSMPHGAEKFEVSLEDIPAGPSSDLLALIPDGGAVTEGWLSAFARQLASVAQDAEGLEALLSVARVADRRAALNDEADSRHALTACGEIVGAFLDVARMSRAPFGQSSESGRMVLAIAEVDGRTNEQIAAATGLSITQVSRTGRKLVREGWASSSRLGRANAWTLTPNGVRVVEMLSTKPSEQRESAATLLPEVAVMRAVASADGRMSVASIAEATGIGRRSVSAAVARLTREEYLVPHSPSANETADDGWVQLAVDDSPQRAIGITVQPGVLLGVLTTMTAEWAGSPCRIEVDTSNPAEVISAASRMAESLIEEARIDRARVVGIGLNLPGHVDGDTGTVILSHSLGGSHPWTKVDLAQRLKDHSGFRVVIENDVNALAVHAQSFGAARSLRNVAVVYIAPNGGVGAGLVIDGRLIHGHAWAAGELGHIPVPGSSYRCRYGHVGCVEASMYVSALREQIQPGSQGMADSYSQAASLVASEEHADSRGAATRAFHRAGRHLGVALAAVVNLVNPEKLLLSGPMELISTDAYASARAFNRGLAETFEAHGLGGLGQTTTIERAYQGSYDAALGAAATLLRRTVYATPAEVPATAVNAVPWLSDQSPRDERRSAATAAAVVGV